MIISSKEIMRRLVQSSMDKGEISAEEYKAVATDLGIVSQQSRIRTQRIDTKTGKPLGLETLQVSIVDDVVFLYIDNHKIKKTWRMPIELWEILRNPVDLDDEE